MSVATYKVIRVRRLDDADTIDYLRIEPDYGNLEWVRREDEGGRFSLVEAALLARVLSAEDPRGSICASRAD